MGSIFDRLRKALPKGARLTPIAGDPNPDTAFGDQTENNANRGGFLGTLPKSSFPYQTPAEQAVTADTLGGQTKTTEANSQINYSGVRNGNGYTAAFLASQDLRLPGGEWAGHPEQPAAQALVNTPHGAYPRVDGINDHSFWSHPNFYDWHDGHTDHHNPKPWDKQTAIETAQSLGLIKNDQAAGVGVSTYAQFAAPYGQVISGTPSNLFHYDYTDKLPAVQDLVKKHGFNVYYAGGKYGKPDLANKNYNTGHLMIYDPTPASGGDFGNENYTNAWRQIHELAHALTYPELNNVYGEGRRIGRLGHHRTLNEAMRAVHWEHLAAHKQRELSRKIGVHIPDDVFNKEYNTVMHDAVHRAVTGKFTEPSQEGFAPHAHKVPLEVALDAVRDHGKKLGLQGQHDLVRKHELRPMVKFVKNQSGYRLATPEEFEANISSMNQSQLENPRNYSNKRLWIAHDGNSGYGLTPDNELVNVFSKAKGHGANAVQHAITQGAQHLNAFDDGHLPLFYSKHGFQEYGRSKNWTPGGPDVVFMKLPSVQKALPKGAKLPSHGASHVAADNTKTYSYWPKTDFGDQTENNANRAGFVPHMSTNELAVAGDMMGGHATQKDARLRHPSHILDAVPKDQVAGMLDTYNNDQALSEPGAPNYWGWGSTYATEEAEMQDKKYWSEIDRAANDAWARSPLNKLKKAARSWKSRDGITIPRQNSPERRAYDQRYAAAVARHFANGDASRMRRIKVPVNQPTGSNMAVNKDRLNLYTRMAAAGDRLPPVVVRRNGLGYSLVDGNHRQAAAQKAGLTHLDAFEIE